MIDAIEPMLHETKLSCYVFDQVGNLRLVWSQEDC